MTDEINDENNSFEDKIPKFAKKKKKFTNFVMFDAQYLCQLEFLSEKVLRFKWFK